MVLNSNGQGVATNVIPSRYHYTDDWAEGVFSLVGVVGVDMDISGIMVSPEYRFSIVGSAYTDWEPEGNPPYESDMPSASAFLISVGFRY